MNIDRNLNIIFYFEASVEKGLGKLYRCRSIAIELIKYENFNIIICTEQKELSDIWHKQLKCKWLSPKEITEYKNIDIIILDISDYPLKLQTILKQKCKFLVGIDDWGMGPFIYDVLLRPNILNLPAPVQLNKTFKLYYGGQYVLLDPKYSDQTIKIENKKCAEKIFICFGGSDPNDYSLRIIKILFEMNLNDKFNFIIVLGPAFVNAQKVILLLQNKNNFKIFQNPENMIELFNSCDTAIISGGNLLYEACALGIPSLSLAQEKEQHEETKLFAEKNAVIRPKEGMYASNETIMKCIKTLFWDTDIRIKLKTNSQKCISKSGTKLFSKSIIADFRKIFDSQIDESL